MTQKPIGKKEACKPAKVVKSVKSVKSVKKLIPVGRTIGNSRPPHKLKEKLTDEAYDRGFNDGYSKGLEDCGVDESR